MVLNVSRDGRRYGHRGIGILWDVMTFWPRANHPFTPPCYGEWAVPQLVGQLEDLQQRHSPIPVVLAAHSRASIIAAAALLYPNTGEVKQVALMTFGSPLRRLYAKNFPGLLW
jgi:hypothetical protein